MLSLKKKDSAIHVCDLVRGRSKRTPVYYYHDVDDSLLMEVDSVDSLLQGHREDIKQYLKVNTETLDAAVALLQEDREPGDDDKQSVRKTYWHITKLVKSLLREEMDLRDMKGKAKFEVNYAPKKDDWSFGTAFCAGSSGSGKTWWVTELILRHWKTASPQQRRHVYYLSPELHEDTTLRRISDVRKYEDWFHGIDVSIDAFEASGQTADDFFKQVVFDQVHHQRNAIIVCDDYQDSGIPSQLRKYTDRLLRTGRHKGISCITLQHNLRNSAFSRQSVASCKHIVLFPRSQRGKVMNFLKDSVGLSLRQSKELTTLMAASGRAAVLRMHAPMMLIAEQYIKVL